MASWVVPHSVGPQFPGFLVDYENGYYNDIKICKTLQTLLDFLDRFDEHREELLEMFNYKLKDLKDPNLWKR